MHRIVSVPARRAARAVLAWALVLVFLPSLSGCAWLEMHERRLALRPTPTQPQHVAAATPAFRPGDTRELIALPGGEQLALWWLPHADADAPTLLYLHGTFRNLYQNMPKIVALREAGFAIVAVDYRGWGDSTPLVPSEATIHADALLGWRELQQRQPRADRRVIYGHSMGGAVAVTLAATLRGGTEYDRLILESTFTRMPDVAAAAGFWGRVAAGATSLEFDSLARIGRIDAPILILHGSADKTVPVELGRRLRDAAPAGTRWVEFPGGTHSRLQSEAPEAYRAALQDFINLRNEQRKARPAPPSRATSP
jgi:pimeloyl-ACP methyl ester carboxylesterase